MRRLLLAVVVLAAGCGLALEDASAPMAETMAATTTTATRLVIVDDYWSADRETYFVVIGGVERRNYCEVHLTLDGRRTGDRGNEFWSDDRSEVTVDVWARHDADGFEVECS